MRGAGWLTWLADLVLAGVVKREEDCDEDEERVRVAKSQSPLTHRNLMGTKAPLSGGVRLTGLLQCSRSRSRERKPSGVLLRVEAGDISTHLNLS